MPKELLETFLDAKITGGKNVGPVQVEHQKHVGGPDTDAFYCHQVLTNLLVAPFVQQCFVDIAGSELLGEVAQIGEFLAGEPGFAQCCFGDGEEFLWCGLLGWKECEEAGEYRACGFAGKLLIHN